jgi:hypothetical protein
MNYKGFFLKRSFTMMAAAGIIALAPLSRAGAMGYKQTNLVSDKAAATNPVALHIDPNLLNPGESRSFLAARFGSRTMPGAFPRSTMEWETKFRSQ